MRTSPSAIPATPTTPPMALGTLMTAACLISACISSQAPEPAILLHLEGSVASAEDSTPLAGAFVQLYVPSGDEERLAAATKTDNTGSFVLWAAVTTAQCSRVQLVASALGRDFGRAIQPQLRCQTDCQHFDFRLNPMSDSMSEPTTRACRIP